MPGTKIKDFLQCTRCGEDFMPGWTLEDGIVTEAEWEPEAYCSEDCHQQYFQFALDEEV
jgi:hypothetical protein